MLVKGIQSAQLDVIREGASYPGLWEFATRCNSKRAFACVSSVTGNAVAAYPRDLQATACFLAQLLAGTDTLNLEGYLVRPHRNVGNHWQISQDNYIINGIAHPVTVGHSKDVASILALGPESLALAFAVKRNIGNISFAPLQGLKRAENFPDLYALTEYTATCTRAVLVREVVYEDDVDVEKACDWLFQQYPNIRHIDIISLMSWVAYDQIKEHEARSIRHHFIEHGVYTLQDIKLPYPTGLYYPTDMSPEYSLLHKGSGVLSLLSESQLRMGWRQGKTLVLGGCDHAIETFKLAHSLQLPFQTACREEFIPENDRVIKNLLQFIDPRTNITYSLYNLWSVNNTLIFLESEGLRWVWFDEPTRQALLRIFYKGIYVYPESRLWGGGELGAPVILTEEDIR